MQITFLYCAKLGTPFFDFDLSINFDSHPPSPAYLAPAVFFIATPSVPA